MLSGYGHNFIRMLAIGLLALLSSCSDDSGGSESASPIATEPTPDGQDNPGSLQISQVDSQLIEQLAADATTGLSILMDEARTAEIVGYAKSVAIGALQIATEQTNLNGPQDDIWQYAALKARQMTISLGLTKEVAKIDVIGPSFSRGSIEALALESVSIENESRGPFVQTILRVTVQGMRNEVASSIESTAIASLILNESMASLSKAKVFDTSAAIVEAVDNMVDSTVGSLDELGVDPNSLNEAVPKLVKSAMENAAQKNVGAGDDAALVQVLATITQSSISGLAGHNALNDATVIQSLAEKVATAAVDGITSTLAIVEQTNGTPALETPLADKTDLLGEVVAGAVKGAYRLSESVVLVNESQNILENALPGITETVVESIDAEWLGGSATFSQAVDKVTTGAVSGVNSGLSFSAQNDESEPNHSTLTLSGALARVTEGLTSGALNNATYSQTEGIIQQVASSATKSLKTVAGIDDQNQINAAMQSIASGATKAVTVAYSADSSEQGPGISLQKQLAEITTGLVSTLDKVGITSAEDVRTSLSSITAGVSTVASAARINANIINETIVGASLEHFGDQISQDDLDDLVAEVSIPDLLVPKIKVIEGIIGSVYMQLAEVSEATKYRIYWAKDEPVFSDDRYIENTWEHVYHNDVEYGGTYYYTAVATDGTRFSRRSAVKSATVLFRQLKYPEALGAYSRQSGQIEVSFSASTEGDYFNIYWSTSPGVTKDNSTRIEFTPRQFNHSYTHLGLRDGTTYYYRVSTFMDGAESELSPEFSAMAAPPAPEPPENFTAVFSDAAVNLSWSKSAHATGYRIHFKTSENVNGRDASFDVGDVSSTVHTGLINNTTYYYRIKALGLGGNSYLNYDEVSATPLDTSTPQVASTTPSETASISLHADIVILFNKTLATSSLSVGSSISNHGNAAFETTNSANDTIRLSPTSNWPVGDDYQMTFNVDDLTGNSLEVTLTYDILGTTVHVHPSGDDTTGSGSASAPFATIQQGIDTAYNLFDDATVKVAQGTYNIDSAAYDYIRLRDGVEVLGGYNPSDWSDRNIASYTTTIHDTSTSDSSGSQFSPARAVYSAYGGVGAKLDGFTVVAGTGDYIAGIYLSSSRAEISNNTITVGEGDIGSYGLYGASNSYGGVHVHHNVINGHQTDFTGSSYGLYLRGMGSDDIFEHNTIDGGGGSSSYGVYSTTGNRATVRLNSIDGGTNAKNYGVYNGNSGITTASINLENNTIVGGSSGSKSYGVYIPGDTLPAATVKNNTISGGTAAETYGVYLSSSEPNFYGNRVSGGNGSSYAYGVYMNSSDAAIYNNMIFGGSGPETYGVYSFQLSNNTIRNNTISGGVGVKSVGLKLYSAYHGTVENNIIFTSGGTTRYCVEDQQNYQTPAGEFHNNVMFQCPGSVYYDSSWSRCTGNNDGDADNKTCNIDDFNSGVVTPWNATGNIGVDPLLIDENGADEDLTTMSDNNWKLSGSSPSSVTEGGLDDESLPAEDKFGYSIDLDAAPRTVPWSMGAYEQD